MSALQVKYGDEQSQAPGNRVPELNHQSDNINHGFGGSFVWLVPVYTPSHDVAAIGFEISIQSQPDPTLSDLAKGAGGDYRYLLLDTNVTQAARITEVVLFRLSDPMEGRPAGWDGNTTDINQGRGKSYLYLLWKTA